MENKEILLELTEIFADILDIDEVNLQYNTTANDIEEWDSLTHIQLIVAIEKKYRIKFTSIEIQAWKNVGDISNLIVEKLK